MVLVDPLLRQLCEANQRESVLMAVNVFYQSRCLLKSTLYWEHRTLAGSWKKEAKSLHRHWRGMTLSFNTRTRASAHSKSLSSVFIAPWSAIRCGLTKTAIRCQPQRFGAYDCYCSLTNGCLRICKVSSEHRTGFALIRV